MEEKKSPIFSLPFHDYQVKRDVSKIRDAHKDLLGLHYGVIAIARNGLPDPLTILSGAAMTMAPVGGNSSRLIRLVRPNLPAPCKNVCEGNGGSKPPA